jgi:CRISPR-associated protein Cmr1
MNVGSQAREWTLLALTSIWTGDAAGQSGHLITTGLLGSIRWWFEVVVRGLDGRACDPSDTQGRCPDKKGRHCVVCELFGCTEWARKFRFQVLDAAGKPQSAQIQKDGTFRLRFVPLRAIRLEEWALIDLTLRLIADYGALGGKTVYKPTDEKSREGEQHHQDFGLVTIEQSPQTACVARSRLSEYAAGGEWAKTNHDTPWAWASLANFWYVGKPYLTRQDANRSSFNKVLGRDERKTCSDCEQDHHPPQKCPMTKKHPRRFSDRSPSDAVDRWLAGGRSESKKVLSFKNPSRTFGFVKPDALDFEGMRQRLRKAWPTLQDKDFIEGPSILSRLLGTELGGAP